MKIDLDGERRYLILAGLLGLFCALGFSGINACWFHRVPPGQVYSGFLQSDQHQYTAIAREVFERGTGFSYVIPYSMDKQAAPVYFHWTFILLAWMKKLSGLSYPILWEIWRAFWSTGFFVSFALLAGKILPDKKHRLLIVIFILGGGGIAVLLTAIKQALFPIPLEEAPGFLEAFIQTEGNAHWWFLNLFRNILYPLEATYHCLYFLTLWALLSGRWKIFAASFFLLATCGVFTTANLAALLGLWLAIEAMITYRTSGNSSVMKIFPRSFLTRTALISSVIIALFLFYYLLLVPTWGEEGGSMLRQHTAYPMPKITWSDSLIAYFWVLAGTLWGLSIPSARKFIKNRPEGRLLIAWAISAFLLAHNDWLFRPYGIQPPHFTRGYLYTALAFMTGISFQLGFNKPWKRSPSFKIFLTLIAFFLISADNLTFVAEIFTRTPHPRVLTFEKETQEALKTLESQGTPKTDLNVLNLGDDKIGILIPVYTQHNSFLADIIPTPNYFQRKQDMESWVGSEGNFPLLDRYDIDLIIVPDEIRKIPQIKTLLEKSSELLWQNDKWTLYKVTVKNK